MYFVGEDGDSLFGEIWMSVAQRRRDAERERGKEGRSKEGRSKEGKLNTLILTL
jgi:hypothetical protein